MICQAFRLPVFLICRAITPKMFQRKSFPLFSSLALTKAGKVAIMADEALRHPRRRAPRFYVRYSEFFYATCEMMHLSYYKYQCTRNMDCISILKLRDFHSGHVLLQLVLLALNKMDLAYFES
jgi:hypothetical protein